MARSPEYTPKQMIAALHQTKGAVYLAAKALGCSHQTVYNYIKDHGEVREAYDYYQGETTDIAELKLREALLAGEPWAVKYQLSTKGRERGYGDRLELTGKDGGPIEHRMSAADVVALINQQRGAGTEEK